MTTGYTFYEDIQIKTNTGGLCQKNFDLRPVGYKLVFLMIRAMVVRANESKCGLIVRGRG